MFGIGCLFFIRRWTFDVPCSTFIFQNNVVRHKCSTVLSRLQMNSRNKKIPLLFLLGIAIFGILFAVVCEPWCPSDQPDIDLPAGTACSYLTHFFGTMETGLSRLFVFVSVSLFFLLSTSAIPKGFFLHPYRPPRRVF